MNDQLKAKLREISKDLLTHYTVNTDDKPLGDLLDEAIAQIGKAYEEEQHTNALIWYTHLTNDLINDDDLKRSGHLGIILEYARIAAGLTEEDVKIVLPDEYIPHDPDFVAEHISPIVKVGKRKGFVAKWTYEPTEHDND